MTFDRTRLRIGLVVAVVAAAVAFLVMQGLGNATTYFYNADEVAGREAELEGKSIRLQGTVVGEPTRSGDGLAFEVAYKCRAVRILHHGGEPELFKPGIPVVLEGEIGGDGVYRSHRIIVRHTSEYRTEESDRLALARDEACPGSSGPVVATQ
jgi:cytochrome c-type biogenesis protein CcmE